MLKICGTLLQDYLQDWKSEFYTCEDIAFEKIKGLFGASGLGLMND